MIETVQSYDYAKSIKAAIDTTYKGRRYVHIFSGNYSIDTYTFTVYNGANGTYNWYGSGADSSFTWTDLSSGLGPYTTP